ncbi:MAG: hypothetical protein U1E26_03130 [Coriobacteriia bacterium]|nr:hypothetical protein [Coriobacteriia bacterium]
MPSDIRVLRPHEFLRSTEDGRLDLEEAKRLLAETALASPRAKRYDVLVDTRSAQSEMTVSDLLDLASGLRAVRGSFAGKTAFVVSPQRVDHAEFFAALAEKQGFEVSVFTSLGDAMTWLIDAEGGTPEPSGTQRVDPFGRSLAGIADSSRGDY